MDIPAPILVETIQPGAGVTVLHYAALLAKAPTAPATLTAAEKAILAQPSIPYNLDAWDGYQAARETVLGTARSLGKNLVVLSGDTRNAGANELADMGGNAVGVEFATSSVSSPGFEDYLPQENPATLAGCTAAAHHPTQILRHLAPGLHAADGHRHRHRMPRRLGVCQRHCQPQLHGQHRQVAQAAGGRLVAA